MIKTCRLSLYLNDAQIRKINTLLVQKDLNELYTIYHLLKEVDY